jgi:hypothetical protein
MAGFLTPDGLKVALESVGDAGTYLGLATSIPDGLDRNLATITEVQTDGYARVPVTWTDAASDDVETSPVRIMNEEIVDFPAVNDNMVPPAAYAFLTDQATGNALTVPTLNPITPEASGGAFEPGTYFWSITAVNDWGETSPSASVSATVIEDGEAPLTWTAIPGATGYKIYRGTAAGEESILVATTGAVTTYTDEGDAGTPNTPPPTVNTAASGRLLYIWVLNEPVSTLAGKPTRIPAGGIGIE